jgi:hypothetical protein
VVERNVLRQKAHAAARGHVSKRVPQQFAPAARGKHEPHGQVYGRRFACSVRPDKTEYLAWFNAQRKIAQGRDPLAPEKAAILLADVAELKGSCGHLSDLRIALGASEKRKSPVSRPGLVKDFALRPV